MALGLPRKRATARRYLFLPGAGSVQKSAEEQVINRHILVIEDEKHTRVTIEMILKKSGFKVTSTENGLSALNKIMSMNSKHEKYDLILLDILMPELGGIEMIDILIENNINIPVIVITGYADKEIKNQLAMKRCNEIIEKPFIPDDLVDRVKAILDEH